MTGRQTEARHILAQTAITLAIVAATFTLAVAGLLWLSQYVAPVGSVRRDPRIFLVILLVIFLGWPAILYRRRYVDQPISGWPRVGFTALCTATLLGLCWLGLLVAGAGGLDGTRIGAAIARMTDLSQPSSRWNAGVSLVLGVWFWITGFIVASTART